MIYLAPYSAERHGVSQAPHTILGIRNGKSLSNLGVVEVPIKWPVQGEANSNEVISDLTEKLKAFAPPGYIVIGGDHSITLAVLRSLAYHYLEPVYLVMYDAHTDDYYSSGVVNSGNWLKVAYEEGLIAGLVFDDGNRGDVLDGVISLEEIPPNAPVHITVESYRGWVGDTVLSYGRLLP
jgi:arginase family enzyme